LLPRLVHGPGEWSWSRCRQQVGAAFATVLVVSTGAFGVVVLGSHFATGDPDERPLDGLTVAEERIPGEIAAIRWFDSRSGRPTDRVRRVRRELRLRRPH
jgi:uncharacterized membrane protein